MIHTRFNPSRSLFVLLFVFTLFNLPVYALAQEATEVPAVETEAPAPLPTPLPDNEAPPVTESPIQLTWTALAGLIAIVLSVGVGGGLAGAVVILRTVRGNDDIKLAMEKLYLSASPETQRLLRGGAQLLHEAGELADELTDGVLAATSESEAEVVVRRWLQAQGYVFLDAAGQVPRIRHISEGQPGG